MSFAQWIEDRRWAANMRRARAWRRGLSFSRRRAFDEAIRPNVANDPRVGVAYPDAFYHITIDDLLRAMSVRILDPSDDSDLHLYRNKK